MFRSAVVVFLAGASFVFSQSAPDAEAHFQRGATLARGGDIDRAEKEYLAGLQLDPRSAAAYNNLGVLYFQRQDFAAATRAFGSARKLAPDDIEIAFNTGLALYKTGKAHEAIPHLVAAKESSHAVDAHYLLGACYFADRNWEQSIAELESLEARNAERPESIFMLAHAYRYAARPAESLDAAARLVKSYPESPFSHQILGEAYDKDGQAEKAIEEFQKAVTASPMAPELHFVLGYVCWRWKQYDAATAALKEEIRINPAYAAAYFYLGDIALRQGDDTSALRYFRDALRLDSAYSEADLGLGKLYFRAGRIQEAIVAIEKAKRGLGETAEVHYWLGRALIRDGREKEGRSELAKLEHLNAARRGGMGEGPNGAPVGERERPQP